MEHREERIIVETARYRITGVLRLPRDGYRSRLTDYLNAAERTFLPLTDVEIRSLEPGARHERRQFLALSISHVVMAMPEDARRSDDELGPVPGEEAGIGGESTGRNGEL